MAFKRLSSIEATDRLAEVQTGTDLVKKQSNYNPSIISLINRIVKTRDDDNYAWKIQEAESDEWYTECNLTISGFRGFIIDAASVGLALFNSDDNKVICNSTFALAPDDSRAIISDRPLITPLYSSHQFNKEQMPESPLVDYRVHGSRTVYNNNGRYSLERTPGSIPEPLACATCVQNRWHISPTKDGKFNKCTGSSRLMFLVYEVALREIDMATRKLQGIKWYSFNSIPTMEGAFEEPFLVTIQIGASASTHNQKTKPFKTQSNGALTSDNAMSLRYYIDWAASNELIGSYRSTPAIFDYVEITSAKPVNAGDMKNIKSIPAFSSAPVFIDGQPLDQNEQKLEYIQAWDIATKQLTKLAADKGLNYEEMYRRQYMSVLRDVLPPAPVVNSPTSEVIDAVVEEDQTIQVFTTD